MFYNDKSNVLHSFMEYYKASRFIKTDKKKHHYKCVYIFSTRNVTSPANLKITCRYIHILYVCYKFSANDYSWYHATGLELVKQILLRVNTIHIIFFLFRYLPKTQSIISVFYISAVWANLAHIHVLADVRLRLGFPVNRAWT